MGTREPGPWLLSICVLGGFLAVPLCSGQNAEAPPDDLLHFLVEKNEASWQKIQSLQSIQYTLEREWLDRESQQPFHGVAQVKRKGNYLWATHRLTIHSGPLRVVREGKGRRGDRMMPMQAFERDTSGGETEQTEMRVVVNDQYVAHWPMLASPEAYRYDHNSVAAMSPMARNVVTMSQPRDFLHGCFGEDRQRFLEAVQTASGRRTYEAVERAGADGGRLYEIRRFYSPDAQKPDVVWVIDPQEGFLATEYVFNAMGEAPVSRVKMRVEQIAPEVWYPVAVEETRYAEPNQPGDPPKVETWSKMVLKDIRVNEPIPDEQFDIEALGLQKDVPTVTVMRTTVDGRTSPYVYREGKLVPQE